MTVTYRSNDTIGKALGASRRGHESGLLDCVVVDNASADGTAELVQRDHPWAALVRSPGNIGFGRGCNLGFARSKTPYVLFLNPDAAMEPRDLRLLVDFLEAHPDAGIAGPALIEPEGVLQMAGILPTPWRLVARAGALPGRGPDPRPIVPGGAPFPADWVCGAALMIRADLMHRLGGFDPRFFLYFEEVDLCRRARALGAEVWTVGEAVAHHVGGASAKKLEGELHQGCLSPHYYRSRFYYLAKHHGWVRAAAAELAEAALLGARDAIDRRRGGGAGSARLRNPLLRMPALPEQPDLPCA